MEKQNRDRAEIDIDHANKHLEKLTADNRTPGPVDSDTSRF